MGRRVPHKPLNAPKLQPQSTKIYTPRSYFEALPLARLFSSSAPLEVEIGCGDGSFLASYASQHREKNFLGIERLLGRIRKLDRKAIRLGLDNLKILRIEASYCVEYLLPPKSIRACHIYFPDPWPKKKHWKRRLIAPKFVEHLAGALEPDGQVFLRTDDEGYFRQMLETFGENLRFRAINAPLELTAVPTDFERTFAKQDITTLRAQYQRVPAIPIPRNQIFALKKS